MADDSDDDQDSRSATQNSIVSVEVKDIFGLKSFGKWGTKIVEVFASGFGTYYDDKTMVSRAKKEAKARLVLSKAETDSEVYHTLCLAEAVRDIDQEDFSSIEGRTAARLSYENVRQQENIEKVVKEAVQYANEREEMGDTPNIEDEKKPDEGWIFEFNDLAKNLTQEDMRKLFGRVLANEVLSPGSFSLRSLITLKTITRKEALSFQKLCQLYFKNIGVVNTVNGWTSNSTISFFGLGYDDLLNVRTAGLIMEGDDLSQHIQPNKSTPTILFYQSSIIPFYNPSDTEINFSVFPFTETGAELFKIIDVQENEEYFRSVEKLFSDKGCTFLPVNPTEKS